MKRIIRYLLYCAALLFLLLCPKQTMDAVREGLRLCAVSIIPSLFAFCVLTTMMLKTGFLQWLSAPLKKPAAVLFGVSDQGAAAFLPGILAGYPIGAKTVAELYRSNRIGREEAERLSAFCNNAGPLFLIGTVGIGLFHNQRIGIFLWLCHLLSAILTGILLRKKARPCPPVPPEPLSPDHLLEEAVGSAVLSVLKICGYFLLFRIASAALAQLVPPHSLPLAILSGILEMTNGAAELAGLGSIPLRTAVSLTSAIIGFGGCCVHAQSFGLLSSLSKKTYLAGKLLQGMLGFVLAQTLFPCFVRVCPVFSYAIPTERALYGQYKLSLFVTAAAFLIAVGSQFAVSLCSEKRHRDPRGLR